MQKNRYFFCKKERICSNREKEILFTSKDKKFSAPIFSKYNFLENNDYILKVIVIVPKKIIKKANKRNLLKRRIREAYRLNNYFLKDSLIKSNKFLLLSIIYTESNILSYKEIEKSLIEIFKYINDKI